jgi:YihY family inner membrane protein
MDPGGRTNPQMTRSFSKFTTLRETVREFMGDRPMELSAAVSYYTLRSLAPIVLVTVAGASLLFRREDVEARIVTEIQGLVGQAGAEVIQSVLRSSDDPATSRLSLAIGIVTLLAGATTVFVQLQDSLNRVWDVEARPKERDLSLKERLLSLAMVFGVGFLLLVSLLVNTALSAVGDWGGGQIANTAVSLGVITLLFAMMFKYLPDAKVAWRDVWRRADHRGLLHAREVPDRPLPRARLRRLGLRRRRLRRRADGLGVLRVAHLLLRMELTHVHSKQTRHRVEPTSTRSR